jgi:Leucine-rich repeat (LRR) protein
LRELPEGIGGLSRLRVLYLGCNRGLQALPPGLCALTSLQDLRLNNCGLLALPEGMEGLIGLRTLMLGGNDY